MVIRSICKTDVVTAEKGATLRTVVQLMHSHHVGSVVITEGYEGKKIPVGIVTDRDITLSLGSVHKLQDLRVEQVMQSQPIMAKESEGIFETILKMKKQGVRRLPVINEDGSLYGIVSADDLLKFLVEEISSLSKITEVQIKKEQGIKMPSPEGQVRFY